MFPVINAFKCDGFGACDFELPQFYGHSEVHEAYCFKH